MKIIKQASKQASKQNSLTRLSLITLLISTSFYPVQSVAADDTTWDLQTGKGLNATDDTKKIKITLQLDTIANQRVIML